MAIWKRVILLSSATAFVAGAAFAQQAEGEGEGASLASIVAEWSQSAHADATAEAFTHWNDEGEVPGECALCHAGTGFRDYYGIDGSAVGTIDSTISIGGVIDCDTCHKEGVEAITEVSFPSGVSMAALDNSATCMTCHQGRLSGPGVEAALAGMEVDTPNPELRFLNPHYRAAAATLFGSEVSGMYEYDGQSYLTRFEHVPSAQACATCHEPHTLEVRVETCKTCHASAEEPAAIRVNRVDFDGDGTGLTGISHEIAAMTGILSEHIRAYAANVAGTPVIYAENYPYFFVDTNANGEVDDGENAFPNAYNAWTPRMMRAAYNYQFVKKDPGAYAHNPRYTLQILYDSIADLAGPLDRDVSMLTRAE